MPAPRSPINLRLRLHHGDRLVFGPGRADLLEAIAATGSIAAAGRSMGMSYKRAWQLVDDLNRCFSASLVRASKGGGHGGGAELTPGGRKVLDAYRRIENKAKTSGRAELRALARLTKRG